MIKPDKIAELKRVSEMAKDGQHLQSVIRKIVNGSASETFDL